MALRARDVAVGTAGMVAGALIGAGAALLFAPKSGEETRKEISRLGKKARRRVDELTDDFSGKVEDVIRSMEGTAREIVEKGRGAAIGTSRSLRGAVEEGRSALGRRFAS